MGTSYLSTCELKQPGHIAIMVSDRDQKAQADIVSPDPADLTTAQIVEFVNFQLYLVAYLQVCGFGTNLNSGLGNIGNGAFPMASTIIKQDTTKDGSSSQAVSFVFVGIHLPGSLTVCRVFIKY